MVLCKFLLLFLYCFVKSSLYCLVKSPLHCLVKSPLHCLVKARRSEIREREREREKYNVVEIDCIETHEKNT